jgi:hypothetical protein
MRLVVLARSLLGELHADDVPSGGRCVGDDLLLGRDAEEVLDVVELAVPDEEREAAEPRATRRWSSWPLLLSGSTGSCGVRG